MLTAVLIVAADQITKSRVTATLPISVTIPVWPPVVYLYHTTNDGVAWSLLRRQTGLMSFMAVAFCIGLLVFGRDAIRKSTPVAIAMGLLLGGALGNLIDRVRLGYVVDFIDVHIGSFYRWPTFNVADSAITSGMILIVIYFWLMEHPDAVPAKADEVVCGCAASE